MPYSAENAAEKKNISRAQKWVNERRRKKREEIASHRDFEVSNRNGRGTSLLVGCNCLKHDRNLIFPVFTILRGKRDSALLLGATPGFQKECYFEWFETNQLRLTEADSTNFLKDFWANREFQLRKFCKRTKTEIQIIFSLLKMESLFAQKCSGPNKIARQKTCSWN